MITQTSAPCGVALLFSSAFQMAQKSIVTKWLYRSGIQLEALLLLRALMSLPLIWGWAGWWLGESMRGLQLVGSLLCVSGVLILEVGRKRTAAP